VGPGDSNLHGCYLRVFFARLQGKAVQHIQNHSCRGLLGHCSCGERRIHVVRSLQLTPRQLYLHHSSTRPFIITVSVVYLLDQVFCLLKTRLVIAEIRPLPTLSSTRIEIPSLRDGWRAGQHVRIRVLSTSLGWFDWMEPHPFTIASAPATEGGEQGLVLICKNAGGWTSRLYGMAKASQPTESGARYASRAVIIQIEGPYGISVTLRSIND
jgi:ferric-chelate reductase